MAGDSRVAGNWEVQFLGAAGAGYILLWIAVFNGYPLVFSDTGEYLVDSFTLDVPFYRTVFYPLFMRMTSFGITPWLVVFAQSAITVLVLYHCVVYVLGHRVSVMATSWVLLVGVVAFLVCGTSLPWFVGQLMPDIFSGLLVLSMFLLLYDRELSTETSAALAVVVTTSVACHLSHLLISIVLLLAVLVLGSFRATRRLAPTRPKRQIIVFVLAPILASSFAVAFSNWHAGSGLTLSPGGRMFLLGRLFASGLAGRYLQQECKIEQLNACGYLSDLPLDETRFLWRGHPLFRAMGGWTRSRQEANRIIFGTIRHNPGPFLRESVKQALRQFVRMKTGDGNGPYESFVLDNFRTFYPQDIPKLKISKQWTGGLQKLANWASDVDLAVFWCSLAGCLLLFASRRHHLGVADKLFVLVLISLLANASVTGTLANVSDRYQSRVSWLMPFCLIVYLLSQLMQRQQESASGSMAGVESAIVQNTDSPNIAA